MNPEFQPRRTRVWWDGGEVEFIRWTEKSLVFSWGDVAETAIHMPRGAVVRLLEKGVLKVEGEMPNWTHSAQLKIKKPDAKPGQTPSVQDHRSSQTGYLEAEKRQSAQQSNRLTIIARLIRKLTGDGHNPAGAAS